MLKRLLSGLVMTGFVLVLILSSGCAMMVNGSMQRVLFESNPQGAKVTVNGHTGITPTSLYLHRGRTYSVSIEKEGYRTGVAHIEKGWSPWFCGSCILLWGPIELVSLINSSAYVLGPSHISINLERTDAPIY